MLLQHILHIYLFIKLTLLTVFVNYCILKYVIYFNLEFTISKLLYFIYYNTNYEYSKFIL